ncbi:MAG: endolytic transglycosylase MltG [Desulfobacteraceae bacterium]|jgi:UPF0755 protein
MASFSRKRIVLTAVAVFFLMAVFLFLGLGLFFIRPADEGGKERVFVVKEGLSLKEVAAELERDHLIRSKALFMFWTRLMGYSRQIKAGEYALAPHMSPMEILEKLRRGIIITHPVTVPEGFTATQIADLLAEKGLVEKEAFLSLTKDSNILGKHGISGPSLEGYLYPDTYQFGRGISASAIIDVMVGHFWQVVGPYREKAEAIGMKMKEVVVLASIVEKETGRPEERPTIASVFLNRLKRGMRLESDPTVIYGLKNFNGNLRKRDLGKRTPYNTYMIRGLPPGPIANPGLESIKAVIYPAKTKYLYFVSKNDGSHHFSKTLSEHNRAVEIYQKRKRRRPQKTS